MSEMIFNNAKMVLHDQVLNGHVVIRDGVIAEIGEGVTKAAGAVDFDGDYLIPGLIELHTDNLERHIQPRPKVDWPHAAAILAHDGELASVGITTVFDAMRVGSVVSDSKTDYRKYARSLATELLDIRAKDMLKISHFLHLRAEVCSETLITELEEFGEADRVGILSLMDHTPGQRQFRDLSKLKAYVCGKHGLSEADFEEHVAKQVDTRNRLGDLHEAAAVETAHRLGAVLASHDDTTTEHVKTSAGHGIHLAEFPTTVEAARACHEHEIAVMMGAPNIIRGGSHSGNVAAAELAQLGLLDIMSSDYVPSSLLTSAFILADIWQDLPRGISTVTSAPAKAAGLSDRGALVSGHRADLARVKRMNNSPVLRGVWSQGIQVA